MARLLVALCVGVASAVQWTQVVRGLSKLQVDGGSVTSVVCTDTSCSENCETYTFPQNSCIQESTTGGSLTVTCSGDSITVEYYPTSTDCTGFSLTQTESANTCEAATDGVFVKNSCSASPSPPPPPPPSPPTPWDDCTDAAAVNQCLQGKGFQPMDYTNYCAYEQAVVDCAQQNGCLNAYIVAECQGASLWGCADLTCPTNPPPPPSAPIPPPPPAGPVPPADCTADMAKCMGDVDPLTCEGAALQQTCAVTMNCATSIGYTSCQLTKLLCPELECGVPSCVEAIWSTQCGPTEGHGEYCYRCLEENQEALLEANCNDATYELFCGVFTTRTPDPVPVPPGPEPAPPIEPSPPPMPCQQALPTMCQEYKGTGQDCFSCVDRNLDYLMQSGCNDFDFQSYCSNQQSNCTEHLAITCPDLQNAGPSCFDCIFQNQLELQQYGCDMAQEEDYCNAGSPPPPPPSCDDELSALCGDQKNQGPSCFNCTFNHFDELSAARCQERAIYEFCNDQVVPPPAQACGQTLQQVCPNLQGAGDACTSCVVQNQAALDDIGCMPNQIAQYCDGGNGGNNCTATLVKLCGSDAQQGDVCLQCVRQNMAEAMAAGCTDADEQDFCLAPNPPPSRPFPPASPFPPPLPPPPSPVAKKRVRVV